MSALHRLKAYFGMIPAEEFDAAEFDAAEINEHHTTYARQAHNSDIGQGCFYREGLDDYDDGPSASPKRQSPHWSGHPARSPFHPTGPRTLTSRAPQSWSADAPVRGSLAINTTAPETPSIGSDPRSHRSSTPPPFTPIPRTESLIHDEAHPLARIVTLQPHSYNEARPIGERYREGNPVIMNLTAMEDRDAKRLVDFAAGLAFALRGSIDKVTNKVFLLSPPDVEVSAEDRRRIAEGRPIY
jgi:cell division inhibitor SepF